MNEYDIRNYQNGPYEPDDITKVSILIPVVRTENVRGLVDAIRQNSGIAENEYEILTLEDKDREGCPKTLEKLRQKARGDAFCFLGDDTLPEKDFLLVARRMLETLPDACGVVALNDGSNRPEVASHFLVSRNFVEDYLPDNQIFHTSYEHCYGDNELSEIAQRHELYLFAENARIKHNHPIHGTAEYDEHYQRAYDNERWKRDQQNFIRRKIARGEMHLGIALPSVNEKEYSAFWFSLLRMKKPSYWTVLSPVFKRGDMSDIVAIRNALVQQALDWRSNCTHILFIDTDQVFQPDMLERLARHQLPICGTVVHRRYPPYDPCCRVKNFENWIVPPSVYSDEVIKVDRTGFGAILIQTPVFFDLEHKLGGWFKTETDGGGTLGEDYDFCERARKKGYDVWLDTAIPVGHLRTEVVDQTYHTLFMKCQGVEMSY